MVKLLNILINKIKLWWLLKSFDNEVDSNVNKSFNSNYTGEEQSQQKLYNGIIALKRGVKNLTKGSNFNSTLQYVDDRMIDLARNETALELSNRKATASFYVASVKDIKTETDKIKMVSKRIDHYYELQNKVLERQLLKDIREAYKANDKETHRKLLNEWKDKYGKK